MGATSTAASSRRRRSPPRAGADVVFVCVGNDDDVRASCYGPDGALAALEPGAAIVDHTTASATLARELADGRRPARRGLRRRAGVGRPGGRRTGTLTIMCGGDADVVRRGRAVDGGLQPRACTLLGPSGSGQLTKMVNQIAIAGSVQGLAEALDFGRRAGLDPRPA